MPTNAKNLYSFASKYLPGGVCSSARVHKSLGHPIYISRAEGSKVYDYDGNQYIDLSMSFGATLLGHGHPLIKKAINNALELGFPCAYENEYQSKLAQKISESVPCIDMLRFTLSGTETTYYAVKLARAHTGRSKVVKFEGHFHGFNDYLAYNYWPALEEMWPIVTPAMQDIPKYCQEDIIVLPFNNFEKLEETLKARGEEIAAVILEPLNYNSGTIEPLPGFLNKLRELTSKEGIILVFDEILSGFRTGTGCIQKYYDVIPDLCTLGKVIGGGLALSAFGGKSEIMSDIAPLGKVQHTGTYNGLWLPVMAGLAFIDVITAQNFYPEFLNRCEYLYTEINKIMQRLNYLGRVNGIGARCSFLFGSPAEQERLISYQDFIKNDAVMALNFFRVALDHGLYMHSAYHHGISAMHTDEDVSSILTRLEHTILFLKRNNLDRPTTSNETIALF